MSYIKMEFGSYEPVFPFLPSTKEHPEQYLQTQVPETSITYLPLQFEQ